METEPVDLVIAFPLVATLLCGLIAAALGLWWHDRLRDGRVSGRRQSAMATIAGGLVLATVSQGVAIAILWATTPYRTVGTVLALGATAAVLLVWYGVDLLRRRAALASGLAGEEAKLADLERANAELARMARYDHLTGLANRCHFLDHVTRALALAQRRKETLAVVFVDLDNFKPINDTLGHAAGDIILRKIADRLRHLVRASDLVARLGGDEFVIAVDGVADPADAQALVDKIDAAIRRPVRVDGHSATVAASIGVACYPAMASTPEGLIAAADKAMYHVKKSGKRRQQPSPTRKNVIAPEGQQPAVSPVRSEPRQNQGARTHRRSSGGLYTGRHSTRHRSPEDTS